MTPQIHWARALDGRIASVRVLSVILNFRVQRFGEGWRLVWTCEGQRRELLCDTEESAMSQAAAVVTSTFNGRLAQ